MPLGHLLHAGLFALLGAVLTTLTAWTCAVFSEAPLRRDDPRTAATHTQAAWLVPGLFADHPVERTSVCSGFGVQYIDQSAEGCVIGHLPRRMGCESMAELEEREEFRLTTASAGWPLK